VDRREGLLVPIPLLSKTGGPGGRKFDSKETILTFRIFLKRFGARGSLTQRRRSRSERGFNEGGASLTQKAPQGGSPPPRSGSMTIAWTQGTEGTPLSRGRLKVKKSLVHPGAWDEGRVSQEAGKYRIGS